jgi:2-oxoisovalerate dehydrogenase E1 component
VVHEESVHFGFGAEIASQIQEKMFYDLDAPVMRIGSANSFVPYYPELENTVLPQVKNITAKLLELYQI